MTEADRLRADILEASKSLQGSETLDHFLRTKPEHWSELRLLDWLTRPSIEFDGPPADALDNRREEVMAAFKRAVQKPRHG